MVADLQRASGTYAEDGTWDDRAFYRRTGPGADFVLFRTSVPFQLDVGCVAAGTWLLSDSALDRPAAIAEGDGIFPPSRGWQHAQSGASMLISVRPVRGSVAATVVAKQEPKSVEEPEVEEADEDDCDEAEVEQDSPLEEGEQLEEEEAEVEQDSPLEEDGPLEVEESEVEEADEDPDEPLEVEEPEEPQEEESEEPLEVKQYPGYRRLNLDKAQQDRSCKSGSTSGVDKVWHDRACKSGSTSGVDTVWQDFWKECRAWKSGSASGVDKVQESGSASGVDNVWQDRGSWKASSWTAKRSWTASSWRDDAPFLGDGGSRMGSPDDEVDQGAEEEAERAAKRRRGGYDAFQDEAFWKECAAVGVGDTLVWQGRGGWLNKARLLSEAVHRCCVDENPDISERCGALSRWMSFSIVTGERASEVF